MGEVSDGSFNLSTLLEGLFEATNHIEGLFWIVITCTVKK